MEKKENPEKKYLNQSVTLKKLVVFYNGGLPQCVIKNLAPIINFLVSCSN